MSSVTHCRGLRRCSVAGPCFGWNNSAETLRLLNSQPSRQMATGRSFLASESKRLAPMSDNERDNDAIGTRNATDEPRQRPEQAPQYHDVNIPSKEDLDLARLRL